jgi:hypothetical protein
LAANFFANYRDEENGVWGFDVNRAEIRGLLTPLGFQAFRNIMYGGILANVLSLRRWLQRDNWSASMGCKERLETGDTHQAEKSFVC